MEQIHTIPDIDTPLLTALALGIIPADDRDTGAATVNAGSRIAEKINAGTNAALYRAGLATAEGISREQYGKTVAALDAEQIHALLTILRERHAPFFRQLRMDVCALYLGDPGVWSRIGFPGPSTAQGGYPDFDQPQTK